MVNDAKKFLNEVRPSIFGPFGFFGVTLVNVCRELVYDGGWCFRPRGRINSARVDIINVVTLRSGFATKGGE